MLSPFVILILALPLFAAGGVADPHLLRWCAAAAVAALSLGLAARDGRLAALGRGRTIATTLILLVALPLVFAFLAPNDAATVLGEFARMATLGLLALAAYYPLGPLAARRLAPLQAAVPGLLLVADRLIRAGFWPMEVAVHPEEITSTLGNTALVGECAMVSLPFLLLAMGNKSKAYATALLFGLGAPLIYLLLVSDSRGAWLGAAAVIVVHLFLRRRQGGEPEPRRRFALALAALLILLPVLALVGPRAIAGRLATIVDPEHPTNRVRLELWQDALEMGGDHLLAGVGAGRFGAEHGRYRSAREWTISGLGTRVEDPHNEYLRIFAEFGLAGSLFALFGLGLLLTALIRRCRDLGPGGDAARAALAAWAGVLVMAATWGSFRHPTVVVPLALFSALALRERRAGESEAPRRRGLLVFVPALAALGLLLAIVERESSAVALRDRAEALKVEVLAEGELDRRAQALVELGDVGRALVRVASSDLVSTDLRQRLLVTVANLAEQRQLLLGQKGDETPSDEGLVMLMNGARNLPDVESVRALALLQIEKAPALLSGLRLLAALDRMAGRKPEAIADLEKALDLNPNDPEARLLLADLYLEGGTGLYGHAAEILQEQVLRYPTLQPVADRGFEGLARCQGATRDIDLALETVDRWVASCGEDEKRRAVAGELVLHFGETNETLGRFMSDLLTWERRQERGVFRVGELSGLPPRETLRGYLAHLGVHPHDTPVIAALGDLLATEGKGESGLDSLKDRAIAIGRCHFAWEGLLTGDTGRLGVNLRIARSRNPKSGDPYLLEIISRVRSGAVEGAIGALKDLIERGFAPLGHLEKVPELADFLARPEVREILSQTR